MMTTLTRWLRAALAALRLLRDSKAIDNWLAAVRRWFRPT